MVRFILVKMCALSALGLPGLRSLGVELCDLELLIELGRAFPRAQPWSSLFLARGPMPHHSVGPSCQRPTRYRRRTPRRSPHATRSCNVTSPAEPDLSLSKGSADRAFLSQSTFRCPGEMVKCRARWSTFAYKSFVSRRWSRCSN